MFSFIFKSSAEAIHNKTKNMLASQGSQARNIGTVTQPINAEGQARGRVKYHGSFYFAICPYSSATILEGQCVEILEESGVYLVVTPVDKK